MHTSQAGFVPHHGRWGLEQLATSGEELLPSLKMWDWVFGWFSEKAGFGERELEIPAEQCSHPPDNRKQSKNMMPIAQEVGRVVLVIQGVMDVCHYLGVLVANCYWS